MKVVVIGATHAGTASIKSIFQHNENVEVTVYEKNDNVSFLSCGIALYVQGEVEDVKGLFYSSPEELSALGAQMNMRHEVVAINEKEKNVTVKNLETNELFMDTYDKLVVSTGSWPIIPSITGMDDERVILSKNFAHAQHLFQEAHREEVKNVVIIGGGYIGTELVEAFQTCGKNVTLIDGLPRILNKYFDKPFTDRVTDLFEQRGVKVQTGETVEKFISEPEHVQVVTDKGVYKADLVILSIGFSPQTDLLKGKVELTAQGAIITDDYMRTSDKDIYAAGDSVAVHYNPTGDYAYIPLATNAIRQGMLVGMNLQKESVKYMGTQATSGLKLYDLTMAATGLTADSARLMGIDAQAFTMEDNFRPEFMSSTEPVLMTVVYEKTTHRIIGAQLQSKYDISQSANTVSMMIQNKMTLEEMAFVDMLFQPWFDRPFHYLNILAQGALADLDK